MSVTDQQILDQARQSLLDILAGRVAEFFEGSERARLLEIDRLQKLIDSYEAKIAAEAAPVFRRIR